MSSRNAKRKPYSNIKSILVNHLNNLNMTSVELNEEIRASIKDLYLFLRTMEDWENEFFAKSLGVEEKYGSQSLNFLNFFLNVLSYIIYLLNYFTML